MIITSKLVNFQSTSFSASRLCHCHLKQKVQINHDNSPNRTLRRMASYVIKNDAAGHTVYFTNDEE